MRSFWTMIALAITGCASTPALAPCPRVSDAQVSTTAAPTKKSDVTELDVGVLVYDISISDTAQIFHISDQLSQWSEFMHPQYKRWADANNVLGNRQKIALAAHAAVRQRLHYGALDEAFYTTKSVQNALIDAKEVLSPEDFVVEKNLFAAMTPVLQPFVDSHRNGVSALRDRMVAKSDELTNVLNDLVHFTDAYVPKRHVPLWLIASTGKGTGGGGYNAGQMVVEDGSSPEKNVLMHESLHFVLEHRRSDLEAAAKSCGVGLDEMTLEEGIVYAFYPGLVGSPGALSHSLALYQSQGKTSDDNYVRFNRLGQALVPLLEKALVDKTTLAAMLRPACDEWKKIDATKWP